MDQVVATPIRRDRPGTERRLKEAVRTVLFRDGIGALGVNAVAAEAGCDKKLIVRYFGGLGGLLTACLGDDFWPSVEEVCEGAVTAVRAMPVPQRVGLILSNLARALMARPMTLEFLAWETVERTDTTRLLEDRREAWGRDMREQLLDDLGPEPRIVAAASAILSAAILYLLVRRRKIVTFSGMDLRADQGWRDLHDAIVLLATPLEVNGRAARRPRGARSRRERTAGDRR